MSLTYRCARLLALLALLLALGRPGPARSDTPPVPARTVEGVATTQAGKPLAHVTLYLFGLPPGETDGIVLGDQSTVVTDDRGRFVWAVPAALPPLSHYIENGGMRCYALAADRSATSFRLALRPGRRGTDPEEATRDLLERATRPCVTKWLLGGPHPVFSVVVPDTSEVTLAVRGPDGLPLRAQEVQIVSVGLWSDHEGAVVYTGRTDGAGSVRMRWYPGVLRLQVFVPGIGFGSTGTFEALPGQGAAPAAPPLAPFARLSGTVAAGLIKPDVTVRLDDYGFSEHEWYDPSGAVDAGGRWTMDGVLPGQHHLTLAGGNGESQPIEVTVAPGERRSGLAVSAPDPGAAAETAAWVAARAPDSKALARRPSARGRVTDAAGGSAAGVDVLAVCEFITDHGDFWEAWAGRTDAAGEYDIPGLSFDVNGSPTMTPVASVILVAQRPGFPAAIVYARGKPDPLAPGPQSDIQTDLTLPALHTALTIRALQRGKPLADAWVSLTPEDGLARYDRFALNLVFS